ncbi:hypothetical protein ACHAWC_008131 [Mediolabrus comicus]
MLMERLDQLVLLELELPPRQLICMGLLPSLVQLLISVVIRCLLLVLLVQ